MAAEALIVEDAYQRGYADAIADMNYAEIAEQLDTGKNTPRRWVTDIINELSVLLWGIDEERTAGVVK